jgi:hypothetical protein
MVSTPGAGTTLAQFMTVINVDISVNILEWMLPVLSLMAITN